MPRFLPSLIAACAIAASARATLPAPSLVASSPQQWHDYTQSAVREGDFAGFRDSLEQRIQEDLPASALGKLSQPVPALAVAQWRFLHEAMGGDADVLKKVSAGENGTNFLVWLLTTREALDEYLGLTGVIPVKTPREPGIDGWRAIWNAHPDARTPGLWTRVSAACAVVFAGAEKGVTASNRFDFFYESHREGQLIPFFDRESPFDLSFAIYAHGRPNDELEWAQDVVPKNKKDQVSVSTYGFSLIAYRGNNYRGVSVQDGGRYYDFRNGGLPQIMEYGGVCGATSTINVDVANAHGVPAFTAGQPGHCAYVWKRDDKTWSGGNFISGWSETYSPHTQGFWVCDRAASVNLASAAVDAPGFEMGELLRWLGSAWRESDPGMAQGILAEAVKANPLDYGAWADRIDDAMAWKDAPPQTWPGIAEGIVAAFPKYPMALTDLLGRFEVKKLLPAYSDKERIDYAVHAGHAMTSVPSAEQWDLIYSVWKPWMARQIAGFGIPENTANAVAEGNPPAAKSGGAWGQVPEAERPAIESFFAALLPAVEGNAVVAKGVAAAWIALVAQDPGASARVLAWFQRRLGNAANLAELDIAGESALASIRSTPDARAEIAATIRQRLEALPMNNPGQTDALLDLISRSNFHSASAIGTWDGAKLAGGGEKTIEWDITRLVAKAEDQYALHLNFRWTGGAPLALKGVSLLENGREISADNHAETADSLLKPDAAVLSLPTPKPGAQYIVRATAAGGADSAGTVLCRAEPTATFDSNGWSAIGGWSLKDIKAAPVISEGWHDVEFDTGTNAKLAGPVFVHFQYSSYGTPRVMNVRLMVNGREVSSDLHSCSPRDGANATYSLRLPSDAGAAKIKVRALFSEADGYGTVYVRKQEQAVASAGNGGHSS